MSRNAQMIRFLKMIRYLGDNPDGRTIWEIAVEFLVNPKTVRRDLAAMKKAGLPLVEMKHGERKTFRMDGSLPEGHLPPSLRGEPAEAGLTVDAGEIPLAPASNESPPAGFISID